MHNANNLKEYREDMQEALDNEFLRKSMDAFAVGYRINRAKAFADINEPVLIKKIADCKDYAVKNNAALLKQFTEEAEKRGVHVHLAKDAEEANALIAKIAKDNNVKKIIKSKSMTSEETLLNHYLEDEKFEVVETDLGEWIIQMRHEGPSHMVMPAIHLSRYQVQDLFSARTGRELEPDPEKLTKVARQELRRDFADADMGISGANFCVAENGHIGIATNEGNARLTTTAPRIHVAIAGIDKLVPKLTDALTALKVLPRNATGQTLTSYVTWIGGANECAIAEDQKKEMHIVFLDNGRSKIAEDEMFSQIFRCVRCGACANVCPVYRLVGGHKMGHIYIGAIGLILTYFFHSEEKAKNLVHNCINCGACKTVCAGGIDLPGLIKELRARLNQDHGMPIETTLLGKVLKNRKLFHSLLRFGKWAQTPMKKGPYLRHLPLMFMKDQGFRSFPAVADKPFRDRFSEIKPMVHNPKHRVALFSGCVQDFVYPEQMEAAVKVIARHNVAIDFPMDQSCCGLPVQMMGEKQATIDVAKQNVDAFEGANCDYIVTLCASCASHLKESYVELLKGDRDYKEKVKRFSAKIIDFSSYTHDVLGVTADDFNKSDEKVTYHASCHLCRELKVVEQPRNLIAMAGDYAPAAEEDVCCGFGGTFTVKFPELSSTLLDKKLTNIEATKATRLVADCPGCILHLRGGSNVRNNGIKVGHIAELLAENLK